MISVTFPSMRLIDSGRELLDQLADIRKPLRKLGDSFSGTDGQPVAAPTVLDLIHGDYQIVRDLRQDVILTSLRWITRQSVAARRSPSSAKNPCRCSSAIAEMPTIGGRCTESAEHRGVVSSAGVQSRLETTYGVQRRRGRAKLPPTGEASTTCVLLGRMSERFRHDNAETPPDLGGAANVDRQGLVHGATQPTQYRLPITDRTAICSSGLGLRIRIVGKLVRTAAAKRVNGGVGSLRENRRHQ